MPTLTFYFIFLVFLFCFFPLSPLTFSLTTLCSLLSFSLSHIFPFCLSHNPFLLFPFPLTPPLCFSIAHPSPSLSPLFSPSPLSFRPPERRCSLPPPLPPPVASPSGRLKTCFSFYSSLSLDPPSTYPVFATLIRLLRWPRRLCRLSIALSLLRGVVSCGVVAWRWALSLVMDLHRGSDIRDLTCFSALHNVLF